MQDWRTRGARVCGGRIKPKPSARAPQMPAEGDPVALRPGIIMGRQPPSLLTHGVALVVVEAALEHQRRHALVCGQVGAWRCSMQGRVRGAHAVRDKTGCSMRAQ
jgi:hypothetical protein